MSFVPTPPKRGKAKLSPEESKVEEEAADNLMEEIGQQVDAGIGEEEESYSPDIQEIYRKMFAESGKLRLPIKEGVPKAVSADTRLELKDIASSIIEKAKLEGLTPEAEVIRLEQLGDYVYRLPTPDPTKPDLVMKAKELVQMLGKQIIAIAEKTMQKQEQDMQQHGRGWIPEADRITPDQIEDWKNNIAALLKEPEPVIDTAIRKAIQEEFPTLVDAALPEESLLALRRRLGKKYESWLIDSNIKLIRPKRPKGLKSLECESNIVTVEELVDNPIYKDVDMSAVVEAALKTGVKWLPAEITRPPYTKGWAGRAGILQRPGMVVARKDMAHVLGLELDPETKRLVPSPRLLAILNELKTQGKELKVRITKCEKDVSTAPHWLIEWVILATAKNPRKGHTRLDLTNVEEIEGAKSYYLSQRSETMRKKRTSWYKEVSASLQDAFQDARNKTISLIIQSIMKSQNLSKTEAYKFYQEHRQSIGLHEEFHKIFDKIYNLEDARRHIAALVPEKEPKRLECFKVDPNCTIECEKNFMDAVQQYSREAKVDFPIEETKIVVHHMCRPESDFPLATASAWDLSTRGLSNRYKELRDAGLLEPGAERLFSEVERVDKEFLVWEYGPILEWDKNYMHGTVKVDATGKPVEEWAWRTIGSSEDMKYNGYAYDFILDENSRYTFDEDGNIKIKITDPEGKDHDGRIRNIEVHEWELPKLVKGVPGYSRIRDYHRLIKLGKKDIPIIVPSDIIAPTQPEHIPTKKLLEEACATSTSENCMWKMCEKPPYDELVDSIKHLRQLLEPVAKQVREKEQEETMKMHDRAVLRSRLRKAAEEAEARERIEGPVGPGKRIPIETDEQRMLREHLGKEIKTFEEHD